MKILEQYPRKLVKERECTKVSQEQFNEIIEGLKKDGKEF